MVVSVSKVNNKKKPTTKTEKLAVLQCKREGKRFGTSYTLHHYLYKKPFILSGSSS